MSSRTGTNSLVESVVTVRIAVEVNVVSPSGE